MTHDEVEVVVKMKMSVFTGGLFMDPSHWPGLVPTKAEDWAPTSDPGYTMPKAEEQVRGLLLNKTLRQSGKIGFWEWFWGYYDQGQGVTVTEIVSVKTLSQSYVSGE